MYNTKRYGYSIIFINGLYLIVSTPYHYNIENATKFVDIYIGADSISLLNLVNEKEYRNILDLCAGSGIQGLNVVKRCKTKLTSVEFNENAAASIIINSSLNNLEQYTSVVCSDLYSDLYNELEHQKFDCILANPPYVPVPKSIDAPMCGNGGENGFEIAEKIISGYNIFLEDNGYAYMVLECIGDDTNPYIIEVFKRYMKKGTLNLCILTSVPVEMQIAHSVDLMSFLTGCADKSFLQKEFNAIFKKYNATKMYSVVLEYKKNDVNFNVNKLQDFNLAMNKRYIFNEKIKAREKNIPFIEFSIEDNVKFSLNNKMFKNIISHDKVKDVFSNLNVDEYNEYLKVFSLLKHNGIIKFDYEFVE